MEKYHSVKDFNDDNRYVYKTEKYITQAGLEHSATTLLQKDDIIISARGTVGEMAMIPFSMAFNQSCYGIRGKENNDQTFIYYLIKNSVRKLKAITHGSVFDTITRETFDNIEVTIPPLPVQKKIAGVLKSLDVKIELSRQISKNLEEQARCLFDKTFPDSHKGKNKISDYILPQKGNSLQSKDAVPGSVPVVAGGLNPATYHNVANTSAPVITISASGANAGYVKLWNIPVWSSDSSYIDNSITASVYFWYILLKKRQNEIFDAQTGSAQPHIYPSHIGNMPMCSVSQEKMEKFHIQVTPLFELVGKNILENQKLSSLRDTLLPKLMSGEIEV